MSDTLRPLAGGCRCGRVRIEVRGRPVVTMACHCTGCQRMTASAFSLSALFPAECFAVTAGEPVIGGLHGATRHYFCPHCMSWLFTRPEGTDLFVNVRSTMLDEPDWTTPFMETWTREKLPWATTTARRSFAALPAAEEFEGLARAYAEHLSAGE